MSYQHLMQFFFSNSPLMRFYCTKVSLALCHYIRWFLSYQQLTPSRLISWLIKRRLLSCLCNQKSPTGEITTRPLRCVSQVWWSHESITRLFRRIPILVAGRRNYTYSEQCYLTCQKCTDILLMANKLTFIHPLDCLTISPVAADDDPRYRRIKRHFVDHCTPNFGEIHVKSRVYGHFIDVPSFSNQWTIVKYCNLWQWRVS